MLGKERNWDLAGNRIQVLQILVALGQGYLTVSPSSLLAAYSTLSLIRYMIKIMKALNNACIYILLIIVRVIETSASQKSILVQIIFMLPLLIKTNFPRHTLNQLFWKLLKQVHCNISLTVSFTQPQVHKHALCTFLIWTFSKHIDCHAPRRT